jgi:hypothetical protein
MLPKSELAPWLKSVMLFGYEDPTDPPEGEGGEGEGEGEGEGSEDEEKDSLDKLQKALKAERLKNKNLEKKLKGVTPKATTEEGDEEEEESEQDAGKGKPKAPRSAAARAAEAKLQKLQTAFVKSSFASTVRSMATNFVDPDDAVAALDMSMITHEQDEDDPSNIVWDEAEIKTALKDLAKRKPHFLQSGEKDPKTPTRPSGSKFAGARKPNTTDPKAELQGYQSRFPAMRGVRPPQG